MGGTSTTASTQQSQTSPWAPGQGVVNNILGQLNPLIGNSGINQTQTNAINSVEANAAGGNPYAPAIGATASSLLAGGGAMNQAGAVNQNYQNYYNQTNPLASNTNYDPTQDPGMQRLLQTIQGDVGNSVNGQFAAGGRSFSGMNGQTLARGISQGESGALLDQYNANRTAQQGAAGNLYNAGNTTSGALAGMQGQYNTNQQAGAALAPSALSANNYTANQDLSAEALRTGIPAQQLGLLAQIGIPIAGLGSQSTGSSTGTSTMSGAQQFGTILQGIGALIPKGNMSFNF